MAYTFNWENPMIATCLMALTYIFGFVGICYGFVTVLKTTNQTLTVAVLLAVGATGFLSFVRHSIFHISDAKRMGWEVGRRNNFQIEVGLANLAWALLALLVVCCNWGLAVEAACFLIFGFYLLLVAMFLLFIRMVDASDEKADLEGHESSTATRSWLQFFAMVSYGSALTAIGILGMEAAKTN